MDYGKTQFVVAKDKTKNEFLLNQGIEDNSLMKSLGIFAVSVGLILLIVLIYFLIKRFACCGKIRVMISKKIFYSGPIRYIIVGYLKLFNQFLTLLLFGLT